MGWATGIPRPASNQDTARELRTPAKAGASHDSSETSSRQLNETMQLKIEAMKLQVGNRVYFCIDGICIVVEFIRYLIYWPTVNAEIL